LNRPRAVAASVAGTRRWQCAYFTVFRSAARVVEIRAVENDLPIDKKDIQASRVLSSHE